MPRIKIVLVFNSAVILQKIITGEEGRFDIVLFHIDSPVTDRRIHGSMLHLYQNSAATGRKTRQRPQCRHSLPCLYSLCHYRIYCLPVVEEEQGAG